MFICSMLAFRRVVGGQSLKTPKKVKIALTREYRLPETVLDGLISRFTVVIRGEKRCAVGVIHCPARLLMASTFRYTLTADMETRLLAYMLVLCLRLNDYSIPVEEFALDLSIERKRCAHPVLSRITAHSRIQVARTPKEFG